MGEGEEGRRRREEWREEERDSDTGQEQTLVLHVTFHLLSSLTCSLNSIFSKVTVQLTEAVNAVKVSRSTVNTISLSIGIGSSGT